MSKNKIKIETELEKLRADQHWDRIMELVKHSGNQISSVYQQFLSGEAQLEQWLESSASYPHPENGNKNLLRKAKKCLQEVLEDKDKISGNKSREANLLLAKLYYFCAQYDEVLEHLDKSKLDDVDYSNANQVLIRLLKLCAEAYAIKGLSLESQPLKIASKYQKSVRQEHVMMAFQKSTDFVTAYLQEVDKAGHTIEISPSSLMPPPSSNELIAPRGSGSGIGASSSTLNLPIVGSVQILQNHNLGSRMNELIETAIERVPIALIHNHALEEGINHYRKLLKFLDKRFCAAQNIQMTIARQFAELLLRGIPDLRYHMPDASDSVRRVASQAQLGSNQVQFFIEPQVFNPENRWEEALLALLLADSIVCREAVLSRMEEHKIHRLESLENIKAVQNLLCLLLGLLHQHHLIPDLLDRSLKFAYKDLVMYQQLALALISGAQSRRHTYRAYYFLSECLEILNDDNLESGTKKPEAGQMRLFSAKICIESLGNYQEGIEHARCIIKDPKSEWLIGRALLLIGLAQSLQAQQAPSYAGKIDFEGQALQSFRDAIEADSNDVLAWFFLALQLAISRQLTEARSTCEHALQLSADEHASSILLMALLLTASGSYEDALEMVEAGLDQHPNHFGLTVLRMKLELRFRRHQDALFSAKDLLLFWKRQSFWSPAQVHCCSPEAKQTDGGSQTGAGGGGMDNLSTSGRGTVKTSPMSVVTTPMSGQPPLQPHTDVVERESAAASVPTGTITSEFDAVANSLSDSLHLTGGSVTNQAQRSVSAWRLYANVWLELGEMFVESGRFKEVLECVSEAQQAFPSSYQALYLRGRVHQQQGKLAASKSCFLGALGVAPQHLPSLRQLAMCYRLEGNLQMAEKVLRDVVRMNPLEHSTWRFLAIVLAEENKHNEAYECFSTALELEKTAPLLPYTMIPRALHV